MVLLAVARVAFAAYPPLGVDEAYAVAAARGFSLSFFDHPPIGFISPLISAAIVGAESPFIFRLPTILFGTLTAWMIWKIGIALGGFRTGLWALGLYAASPAFVLSGSYIVPDGPLGLGLSVCVYWLTRIVQHGERAPVRWWLWAGLGLAFGLASKYQAALLPIMALIFAVWRPVGRQWFMQAGPYLGAAIGATGLLPTLIWNANNGWASFAFHSGRTADGLNLDNFALMLVGQALYLLPPVALVAAMALWRGLSARTVRDDVLLVCLIALGPILAFNGIYLFSEKSFPHWTMPGWLFALPVAAIPLAATDDAARARMRNWIAVFLIPIAVLSALIAAHARTGVLTSGSDTIPEWDRSLDAFDYSGLGPELEARDLVDEGDLVATWGWIEGGFISTALGGEHPVRVLRGNKHHFRFLPGQNMTGPALFLHPVRIDKAADETARVLRALLRIDEEAVLEPPIILKRGQRDYVHIIVIRLTLP